MDYMGLFISGFTLGFLVCAFASRRLDQRVAKRGHMTVDDVIYDVTERK